MTSPRAVAHRDGSRLQALLPPAVLFAATLLTVLLWIAAVSTTVHAVADLRAQDSATLVSRGCSEEGVCLVSWPTADAAATRTLDRPGLFAPEAGTTVVVVERNGALRQAGWAALADAALLTFLALCFSGFTLSWFRRVLNSTPLMPDDYDYVMRAGDPAVRPRTRGPHE